MWLHLAPAEDIIVVSEIGEQWSPQTAPARHADIPMIRRSAFFAKITVTIGMRIPKVPQDVPVANASTQATRKITAGRKLASAGAAFSISVPTYIFNPKTSFVTFLRDVARKRIRIAGTIALKPEGILSMESLKDTMPLNA